VSEEQKPRCPCCAHEIEPDSLPDEMTITLRKAVTLGEASWSELNLREPTAEEWSRWDKKTGIEADIIAVSAVSGLPEPAVRKIGARDLAKASRFIARFLD
jgi:hypothetical protein